MKINGVTVCRGHRGLKWSRAFGLSRGAQVGGICALGAMLRMRRRSVYRTAAIALTQPMASFGPATAATPTGDAVLGFSAGPWLVD